MKIQHLSGNLEEKLPAGIQSFQNIYEKDRKKYSSRWVYALLVIFIIFLALPWTQNIRAKGYVTTLYQKDRPQQLNSQIPGKILKWYVKEGDMVKAGDTILQLGEVKDDYLDTSIIPRTALQIDENENKARFYEGKIATASTQIANLEEQRVLKLQSLENKRQQIDRKIAAKTAEVAAAAIDLTQSSDQLDRAKKMLQAEAISQFDFERRNATFQKAKATLTDKQNELDNLKQDLTINKLDINNAVQEYSEKIAKAQGDQFSSSSEIASAKEKVASLAIKKQNLQSRASYYFLVAPQAGQIVSAKNAGINEIVKEGEMIVEIIPQNVPYAVEIFIAPMDLPLINIGQKVRFQFDGFPAIVFSGWPSSSYGTFSGKVFAVETNRNVNGKFRVLVIEDSADRPWPPGLRLGAGSEAFALLKDVPVVYELWRNINGFPPEFYQPGASKDTDKKKPLKIKK